VSVFSYNGISLDENEVRIRVARRRMLGQTNQSFLQKIVWDVEGVTLGENSAELTAKLDLRQATFDTQGGDISFTVNGAASHHSLTDAATINGIRSHGLSFTRTNNAQWGWHTEYAYLRSWSCRFEAEILAVENSIIAWNETVSQIGTGGPDFAVLEAINGNPVVQQTAQATSFMAIQKGFAVGATDWPTPPASLWAGSVKPKLFKVSQSLPRMWGRNTNLMYPIQWEYVHEAAVSLSGVPGFPF
jgi:hypothetical protein